MGGGLIAIVAAALGIVAGAHVALLVGLARQKPRWHAVVALVVPPLAPYWGYRAGMRLRVYAWAAALLAYAIGVVVAGR